MKYDPDIHHRRSIRLHGYDYARNGAYFVTICVKGRECLFGGIVNGEMEMNEAGLVVEAACLALPERFPQIQIDEFAVMPNHFHGIVIIADVVGALLAAPQNETQTGFKGTKGAASMGAASSAPTLGMIIRVFKSISAIGVNGVLGRHGMRLWQRNYYERVIRSDNEMDRARQYIRDNPMKWDQDRENPVNVPASPIAGIQRGR